MTSRRPIRPSGISSATCRWCCPCRDWRSRDFQFGVNHSNAEFGSTTNPTNAVRPIRAKGGFAQLKWRHELSDESELSLQFYHTQRDVEDKFQFIVPPVIRPIVGLSELTLRLNYEEQRDNMSSSIQRDCATTCASFGAWKGGVMPCIRRACTGPIRI